MSIVAGSLDFVLAAGATAVVVFAAGLWITTRSRKRRVAETMTAEQAGPPGFEPGHDGL